MNFETASALIICFVLTRLNIISHVPRWLLSGMQMWVPPAEADLKKLVLPKHKRTTKKAAVEPAIFRMAKLNLKKMRLVDVLDYTTVEGWPVGNPCMRAWTRACFGWLGWLDGWLARWVGARGATQHTCMHAKSHPNSTHIQTQPNPTHSHAHAHSGSRWS